MTNTTIRTLLHALLIFISLLSLNTQAGVEITFIHNDALGTPVAGTDEQGNVKWRAHYQPYGEELLGERQLFGVRAGYTGQRADPETGLTYMGARYYSPTIGRFMCSAQDYCRTFYQISDHTIQLKPGWFSRLWS